MSVMMTKLTLNNIRLTSGAHKSYPILCSLICGLTDSQRRKVMTTNQRLSSGLKHDHLSNMILHIGAGNFHRAHQAWYLHRLIESGADKRWSLTVGNIRPDMNPVLEALASQKGVYTLETVTSRGERAYETIRSIERVVPWTPDLNALVATGAAPECKIVSFTVTEAGYYLDEHQHLDQANPDLAADIGGARTTIYGTVSAILGQRMKANNGKVTLQSCDNLRSNGNRFKTGLLEFLELRGENTVRDWMLANATCPNAMVDRITPRVGPDVCQRVLAATGFDDRAPVMSESFIQWVIEDEFCAGRPAWEKVGAEMVHSVLPHEEAKIRILNATHILIAWAGTLVGHQFIHQGTQDTDIRSFAEDYVTQDVIPCLTPSTLDLAKYRDVVLERFCNSHILDTNQRVAADGFSKMQGFIAPTLRECFARNQDPNGTAVLPALYFRFLELWHKNLLPYEYLDGVMEPAVGHAFFNAADPLKAFVNCKQLWGSLSQSADFERVLRNAVTRVDEWLATRA